MTTYHTIVIRVRYLPPTDTLGGRVNYQLPRWDGAQRTEAFNSKAFTSTDHAKKAFEKADIPILAFGENGGPDDIFMIEYKHCAKVLAFFGLEAER